MFGLADPSPGPLESARRITKLPLLTPQKLCATVFLYFGDGPQIDRVPRTIFNSAASRMIYRPLRRKTRRLLELEGITCNHCD